MDLHEAEVMARQMLKEHGLEHWSHGFDGATQRFGHCRYYDRMITQSRALVEVNKREKVRDNMLHEIAHALEWEQFGTAGHGPRWKQIARSIGHSGARTYGGDVVRTPFVREGVCAQHGVVTCKRAGQSYTGLACGRCCREKNGGKFDRLYLLTWREI